MNSNNTNSWRRVGSDFPDPGIEPTSLESPALVGRFFTTVSPGNPREKQNSENLESNIFKSCIVYKHLCDLPVPGCV